MQNMYNPEWWEEWRAKNYQKQLNLLQKTAGKSNFIRKLINLFV